MESTTKIDVSNDYLKEKDMSLDQKVRKLASIQKIDKTFPHTNADKLEIAKVLGWDVIVPANLYKPGDIIVYFEIDSKLPEADWSEIMRKEKFQVKTRKIRDKLTQGLIMPFTILGTTACEQYKLGDDVTKVLGVTKYENDADLLQYNKTKNQNENQSKEIQTNNNNTKNNIENESAEEKAKRKEQNKILMAEKKLEKQKKIAKQQAELEARRENIEFPSHLGIPKTDEPRIQSFPEILQDFQGKAYYATLKYDGCSATYCYDTDKVIMRKKNTSKKLAKGNNKKHKNTEEAKTPEINIPKENLDESLEETYDFLICSRNYIAAESQYKKAEENYKIKEKLEKAGYHIAIQCEIYGPKIAKNPLNAKEVSIAVFNVFDIKEKRFYDFDEMEKFCKEYELPMVHVLEKGDSFNYPTIDELLEKVKGNYEGTDNPREGIIYRTQKDFHLVYDEEEICEKLGDIPNEDKKKYLDKLKRMSFKVINNDYLVFKNPKK